MPENVLKKLTKNAWKTDPVRSQIGRFSLL